MSESVRRPSARVRMGERINDLLHDARAAREQGEWRLTQSLVSAVLALDPGNAEAANLTAGAASRRQMTLLFCDIVGSTQLADNRDPEDVSLLLRTYRSTCVEIVDQYGGFVDDYRGDGMLVLFGYPQVHEDDARRAVQCGLTIISTLPRRFRALGGIAADSRPQVRIAVHTDLVVIDGVGVSGATANEAARIQDFAMPDTLVVSSATKALVGPYFETESIGEVALRGVSRPVEIFTVVRSRNSMQPAGRRGPFVGREVELARLGAFVDSRARALLVTGAPGVGKTRLVSEASDHYGLRAVICGCSRFHRNTSLRPFRSLIEGSCGIEEADQPETRLAKLRVRVADHPQSVGDLPFLAAAMDIPLLLLTPPVEVDPPLLRLRALHVAAELIGSLRSATPLTLFIEDVQWADQSSIDLITLLLSTAPADVHVIMTAREGFASPWPHELVARLDLDPLNRESMAELADRSPAGANLTAEDRQELIDRSDGIPLFLEELLRTADDIGAGRVSHRSIRFGDYQIPPALRDPLLARLLSPQVDLELAQVAATIGRDVEPELLHLVVRRDAAEFAARLENLSAAGLLESTESGVRFRHEMIREVAYETQKRSTLRANHSLIADRIVEIARELNPRVHGESAFHLERAHRYQEAIAAHLEVAGADQALGAHIEAKRRLSHALDLLNHLSPGTHQQTELRIRGMRSFSAVMTGGYAAPEAAADYHESVELCRALAGAPEIVPSLINSWSYYAMRGDLAQADVVAGAMIEESLDVGSGFPAKAVGKGINGFFRGRFDESRRLLESFVESDWGATAERPPPIWPLPNDPLVAIHAHLLLISWITGSQRGAQVWADHGRERSSHLSFPYGAFSLGYLEHFVALMRTLEGDFAGVAQAGEALTRLGERHGFALWQLVGALHLAVSAVHLGQHEAVDQLAAGLATARVVLASDVYTPYWLTELAVAQNLAGRQQDATRSAEEALQVAQETGSTFYSAETLRVLGLLRIQLGTPGGVDVLRQAVDLARRQGATALEQRAAASLAEVSG